MSKKERVKYEQNTATRRQRHGNKSKEEAEKKQTKSKVEAEKPPGTQVKHPDKSGTSRLRLAS